MCNMEDKTKKEGNTHGKPLNKENIASLLGKETGQIKWSISGHRGTNITKLQKTSSGDAKRKKGTGKARKGKGFQHGKKTEYV